jgi:hypothetical protein
VGYNWIAWQGANFDFNYKDWLELGVSGRYSLNSTRYTISQQNRYTSSAFVIGSTMRADLPGSFTLRYDFDYTINQGLAETVQKNTAILNASVEKVIFKKKNGFIRFSGFDIFNQNVNINRQVTGNSIIDSRTMRLTRYFMLSFTYRLNRFTASGSQQGQQQQRQQRPFLSSFAFQFFILVGITLACGQQRQQTTGKIFSPSTRTGAETFNFRNQSPVCK